MSEELNEESNLPPDNRRQFDRSRLIVDVFFDGADGTAIASTKDISPGGLYMNTQTELPEGSLLTLRLPFPEGDVIVNAEVVYINPGLGVGVRFQGLLDKDRSVMQRALGES